MLWSEDGEVHIITVDSSDFVGSPDCWVDLAWSTVESNWAERKNGQPNIIGTDGYRHWRNKNGRLHREDGPAVITSRGHETWYLNGLCYLSEEEWRYAVE